MPTTTDKLIAKKDGGIGWIIFNNPAKRNAMSMDMYLAMADALNDYARDPAVRVVILKGAGDKAFVSGADISEFKERRATAEAKAEYEAASDRAAKALRECPKPTIASIRGFCMGGGMGTAVSCDLRIASDDSRFGVPAAKLGVGYRYARLKQLEALVGPSFTMEIFYTGRQFSTEEALAMGLVNRVVGVGELDDATLELANEIAKNDPVAIAMTKKSINRAWEVAGFREAIVSNVEMDSIIEAAEVPERIEFRKITQEQGLKAAIAWRDARFRERNA